MARRKLALVLTVATVLMLLASNPAFAATCWWDGMWYLSEKCVWDWGCWANPLTPNGQYWTYEYHHYQCDDGSSYWKLYDKWESGGCCTP